MSPALFEPAVLGGSLLRGGIGARIVSVIATSSGAAAGYVEDHLTNLRIAMRLEIATMAGAITGVIVSGLVNARALFVVFGVGVSI